MGEEIRLTDQYSKQLREQQEVDDRAWHILDAICAEWRSDPQSVMCFDLGLVQEAIDLVRRRKAMRFDPFNPFTAKQPTPTGLAREE